MKLLVSVVFLLTFVVGSQDVVAKKGCLNLVVDNKLGVAGYSLLFTVKNTGEDVVFEQADLLPWQTREDIFSARLVPASNPELELAGKNAALKTDKIVALFPRDTISKAVLLGERYKTAPEMLQAEDLLFFWDYRPHQECPKQEGKVLLLKLK